LLTAAIAWTIAILAAATAQAAPESPTARGDRMFAAYFEAETARLSTASSLTEFKTLDAWKARRGELRRQLLEMLGLDPMPERTDLKPIVTGRIERGGITVEKLQFQSRPHLYVTGNLYLPKDLTKPVPAILYVCGHSLMKIGGISYGNKTFYQYHGCWLAAHGYACLIIDSLQLGEIEGIHHGTYREGMWWWINRGYTPAGVEAWNCVRAIDYLQSRKEIDPERIGVTGRSGGGAYSWWISAIDERIKAAVPAAGITDLRNHVVDGCVEGHCDCMFMTNTYRWDYPRVAALVAPRPLLLSNSDRDDIFPLDGVVRTYNQARHIYELYRAGGDLGLLIVPGPHKDCQELQVPAFRWFNKHLRGDTQTLVRDAAEKQFTPQELKVFAELPKDQLNSTIHETFIPAAAAPPIPATTKEWNTLRDGWLKALCEKTFAACPTTPEPLDVRKAYAVKHAGLRLAAYDFTSQGPVQLRLYLVERESPVKPTRLVLKIVGQQDWRQLLAAIPPAAAEDSREGVAVSKPDAAATAKLLDEVRLGVAVAFLAPRGVGLTAFDPSPKKQTQVRRRFLLLGQTLDGMQVWDVRRAIQTLRLLEETKTLRPELSARDVMAGIALYASLFEPGVASLTLENLPATHRNGPILLNVSRYLEMPQAVAMAAERGPVRLLRATASDWNYPQAVVKRLGWKGGALRVE
jgi:acetyl esterase/lipase